MNVLIISLVCEINIPVTDILKKIILETPGLDGSVQVLSCLGDTGWSKNIRPTF